MDCDEDPSLLDALYIEQPEWIFSESDCPDSGPLEPIREKILARAEKYLSRGKPVYSSGILPEKIRKKVRFLGEDACLSSAFSGYREVEVGGAHLNASMEFVPEDATKVADSFREKSPLVYLERCIPAVCYEISKGGARPIINSGLCLGSLLDSSGNPLPGKPYPFRRIAYLGGDYSLGAYFGKALD